MSSTVEQLPESERIAKWRAERLEVAEREKQARVRQKQEERQLAEAAKQESIRQAALGLLPNDDDISRRTKQISRVYLRSKVLGWITFLLVFALPVGLSGYYLWNVATPLYEANAVVAISRSAPGETGPAAGLFNGLETPSNLQEVFKAQAFIQSQTLMEQLESETSAVSRWQSDVVDPVQRMRSVASLNLSDSTQFNRFVESRVDVQTGLLTLTVHDPDPSTASEIAGVVLSLTENRLANLGNEMIDQQLQNANDAVETAKQDLLAAQESLLQSQLQSGEMDPRIRVESVYESIRQLEAEAITLSQEYQKTEISGRGDSYQADQTRQLEQRTRDEIAKLRQLLINGDGNTASLNQVLIAHDRALLQVQIAEDALENAFNNLAEASKTAEDSRNVFQVVVSPTATKTPTSPKTVPVLGLISLLFGALFVFIRLLGRQARTA